MRLGPQHGVQRFLRKVLISIALGLPGIGLIALVTRTPEGNSMGFPFAWSAPTSPCFAPNPLNGCGFTYNVPMIALDLRYLGRTHLRAPVRCPTPPQSRIEGGSFLVPGGFVPRRTDQPEPRHGVMF